LVGDFRFDLLRRRAGLHRGHEHRRKIDLRKAIDAEPRERERADHGEREDENGREDRSFDAEFGKPLHDQLTFIPSANCATLAVARRSPALRPFVTSMRWPMARTVGTIRSSTRSPLWMK